MVRTHASFDAVTDTLDGEPPFGADVVALLAGGLGARGVETTAPDELDYAYELKASTAQGDFWMVLGYVGDADGREWLLIVEPRRQGVLRRKAPDPAQVLAVVHEVLTDDVGAEPQWFTAEEWNDSAHDRGAPAPGA